MNSFNHYAYGAIGDWLYSCVAGIDTDKNQAGYKHIHIRPQPGEGLSWAEGKFESMYGEIRSYWRKSDDGAMELQVTIPPNTSAEIKLPGAVQERVKENGMALHQIPGIGAVHQLEDGVAVMAGSGEYRFEW